MTAIAPFRGVHYNPQKVTLEKVLCPPYDVIPADRQKELHRRDPHNFIHIDFRMDEPGGDKYEQAAKDFSAWKASGVLVEDDTPAFYFYSHQYTVKGEKRIRLGFFARLKLGEKNFGHEHTRSEAKEDRLKLTRKVKANLSPIFVVFEDRNRLVQRAYRFVLDKKPLLEVAEQDQVHKLWRIDDPALVAQIQEKIGDENIFIADGHHRYEIACTLRDEVKAPAGSPYNYVMAYFTDSSGKGLTVLPIHRLVRLAAPLDLGRTRESLNAFFEIEECKDQNRFFFLMEKGGRSEHLIGMQYGRQFWLLRLRNVKILDKIIADKPKEYRTLDVSILNYLVMKKTLGLEPDDKSYVSYHHEREEVLSAVKASDTCVGFYLNPVKMEQIIAVALAGHKMPPKSTFFYPKVPSGLLINPLE